MKNYTGIVLFGAPWCAPCKAAKATLEGTDYKYVDVDMDPITAGNYDIVGVPHLLAVRNGVEVARSQSVNKQSISWLKKALEG